MTATWKMDNIFFFSISLTFHHNSRMKQNERYIDNHNTIRLAGHSISLYHSIFSHVALDEIQEPHSK